MKLALFIISLIILTGCKSSYESEEFIAINDFVNDYLKKNPLYHILNPTPFHLDEKTAKIPNIDTLDLKVYISDALLPIAQIKEDNEWMFNDNYRNQDSVTFYGIVNSKKFNELNYREFDKAKLKLIKPFRQFEKSQEKITADEEYTILNLSRVCFDEKKENGIIVVEYLKGFESGSMSGYYMPLLIKKKGNNWIYIPRK